MNARRLWRRGNIRRRPFRGLTAGPRVHLMPSSVSAPRRGKVFSASSKAGGLATFGRKAQNILPRFHSAALVSEGLFQKTTLATRFSRSLHTCREICRGIFLESENRKISFGQSAQALIF